MSEVSKGFAKCVTARYSISIAFFKNGPTLASFIVYFRSIQTNNTIFTTNICEKCPSSKSIVKNGPTRASFSFKFGKFKQTIQFLQQINKKKCPSSIQCRDSNPQPFQLHSSPTTTRPGRLPFNVLLWGRGRANKMFCASTQIKSSQLHPQVLMEPSEMKFKSFPTRWRQFKTFDPSCYSKMKTAATAPTTATALFESPLICLSTSTLSWVVAGSWLRQHFWPQRHLH